MIRFYTKLAVIFILVCVFIFFIFFTKCKEKEHFYATTTTAVPTTTAAPTTTSMPTEICLTNSVNNTNNNFISNCVTFENSEPIRADWFKIPESSSSTISADNKLEQLNKLNISEDVVCAVTSIECQLTGSNENCNHCTASNNGSFR